MATKRKCKCECHKPTMMSPSGKKSRASICSECMENHKLNKHYQVLKAVVKVMGI